MNASRVVVENGASPLPAPVVITTGNVDSCAPMATSGEVVCIENPGDIDLIQPGATSASVIHTGLSSTSSGNSYTGGFCVGCGAIVDPALDQGVLATSAGYMTLNLSNNSLSQPIANNNVPVSVDFGYDPVNHRILGASYVVTNHQTFATSGPFYQIINISGTTPQVYELNNEATFFENSGSVCTGSGGSAYSHALPDSNAIDTSTGVAIVTFHSPANCFSNPPEDIGLFDLTQATFTPGNPVGVWDTAGKQFQTLSGVDLNNVTDISVVSPAHLAIIADQFDTNHFGVLQLPSTSGSGVPVAPDWVTGFLPNDPSGAPWRNWSQPNGVTSYTSPNNGKAYGVVMNDGLNSSGAPIGPTYIAIVDLQAMLTAARSSGSPHMINPSINLLGTGIVRFVRAQ